MTESGPANLVDRLVQQIQQKIVSGEYAPGQKLRQVELAETFQVSRTPVRHALSQLTDLGLVESEGQSGASVKSQTPKDVRDMYCVRAEIEGLAAELAAHWMTDVQLAELRSVHDRFVHAVFSLHQTPQQEMGRRNGQTVAETTREWVSSNVEFHQLIYRASCNEYIAKVIGDLHLGSSRGLIAASAIGMYRHRMEINVKDHAAILGALEARDPQRSRACMSAHVIASGEFVAAWLENQAQQ